MIIPNYLLPACALVTQPFQTWELMPKDSLVVSILSAIRPGYTQRFTMPYSYSYSGSVWNTVWLVWLYTLNILVARKLANICTIASKFNNSGFIINRNFAGANGIITKLNYNKVTFFHKNCPLY